MRGQCSNPPRVYPCREDYGAYKGKHRSAGGFGAMMRPGNAPAPALFPGPGRPYQGLPWELGPSPLRPFSRLPGP